MSYNYILACNWKDNGSKELIADFEENLQRIGDSAEIILCPPSVYLDRCNQKLGAKFAIGAQDVSMHTEGPYTGEVSPLMIEDVGCEYVIVGHSERRQVFGEDEHLLKNKIEVSVIAGLTVILCVGEREKGESSDFVLEQLKILNSFNLQNIIVAYEPIWSIGTGVVPTPEDIYNVVSDIKREYNLKVLYGGSVKSSNIKEILSVEGVDGVLVGGASLMVEEVIQMSNLNV